MSTNAEPPPGAKPPTRFDRVMKVLLIPAAVVLFVAWWLFVLFVRSFIDPGVGWLLEWWWVPVGVLLLIALGGYLVGRLTPTKSVPSPPPAGPPDPGRWRRKWGRPGPPGTPTPSAGPE